MQLENGEDETPRSPTHRRVNNAKESMHKLKQLLHGNRLDDLPLDFIGTQYFTDLYLLDAVMGSGSFGVVLKAVERSTGQEFAIKLLSKQEMSPAELDAYLNEARMLKRIDHPNIVKLKCVFFVMDETGIVKAGTLKALMKYRKLKGNPLTEDECSCIMRQIFEGIAHIHRLDIVHRDLKPQNILMRAFHQLEGSVKIADFGLGMQDSYASTDKCGTMIYMAPEQLNKSIYRKEVDIWAAGIIMYTIVAGEHPLYEKSDTPQIYAAKVANPKFNFPGHFSELAKDFFMRLCNVNVGYRYCATTALNHPWITREFGMPIPLTVYEEHTRNQISTELTNVVRAVFFAVECSERGEIPNYRRSPLSATSTIIDTSKELNKKYYFIKTAKKASKTRREEKKKVNLINAPIPNKRDPAGEALGSARKGLTSKQMQDISKRMFVNSRKQEAGVSASPMLPPRKKSTLGTPQSSFHIKSKTFAPTSSLHKLPKGTSQKILRVDASVFHPGVTQQIVAPRSATLAGKNESQVIFTSGAEPEAKSSKMRRVPSATNKTSTFATREVEKVFKLNDKQAEDFEQIKGMQTLKSKRGLNLELDDNTSNKNTKVKLKPLEKLEHFAVNSPVITKGKHKFFK